MTKWEYARLESRAAGLNVVFTHHPAWSGLAPEAFFDTLKRLGDEGWELVAALPLGAEVTPIMPATPPPPSATDRERRDDPREGRYDPREARHDPRAGREPPAPAPPTPPALPPMSLQIGTERWLLFKRPQPEPPAKGSGPVDMVKDLLPVPPLLKGRLPL